MCAYPMGSYRLAQVNDLWFRGFKPKSFKSFGMNVLYQIFPIYLCIFRRIVTHSLHIEAFRNHAFNTIKSTSCYEQNMFGIYLYIFLIGVFASTFRRYVHHRSFKKFQQRLLHSFTWYITSDRRVVALYGTILSISSINTIPLSAFSTS